MAGASLLPENAQGGGAIPDGDYTIKEVTADLFDYNGQVPEGVPAIMVLYQAADGATYEQPYKVGDNAHLVPSADKTHFVHPSGPGNTAAIYKGGAGHQWLASIFGAGFPRDQVTDKVTAFKGMKVTLVNSAAPKGKTADDKAAGKTIPLVTKILAMPGKAGAAKPATRPTAARTAPAAAPTATSAAPAASATVNGDLDADAIIAVQEALATAPDTKLTVPRLGTAVMLTLAKAKNPNAQAIRKMLTVDWLTANGELGSWIVDGQDVVLAQ